MDSSKPAGGFQCGSGRTAAKWLQPRAMPECDAGRVAFADSCRQRNLWPRDAEWQCEAALALNQAISRVDRPTAANHVVCETLLPEQGSNYHGKLCTRNGVTG
jgi:hypothetical protein